MNNGASDRVQRETATGTGWTLPIGAQPGANGTLFTVWANKRQRVEVVLFTGDDGRETAAYELSKGEGNYFSGHLKGVYAGQRYKYRLDGADLFPDPASRYQPKGVNGPSQVVDPTAFDWTDQNWTGVNLDELVIYEVHIGTATEDGTFDALIPRLKAIRDLGATAIELMPVGDFDGSRNWGYDGVFFYAPSRAYGGPEGLRRLVDKAHHEYNLAVILDVVYNHIGGCETLSQFSDEYFSKNFSTGWGRAFNFETKSGRPVHDFFANNACYWAQEYHIDGLRIDAIHAISEGGEPHILKDIVDRVNRQKPTNRPFVIFAEDTENDPKVADKEGFGLDGVWADDFHHQVRVALTGPQRGYYIDYHGTAAELVETLQQGWFYTGQYAPFFKRPRGHPAKTVPPQCIVHSIENHDQVGNRPFGERLNHLIGRDAYRAASALLLLSPYTPLLFMGQEWAASTRFFFFTDFDEKQGREVTKGRIKDLEVLFPGFSRKQMPKPQNTKTFMRSKLKWEERTEPEHADILRLYQDLLDLRRRLPALRMRSRRSFIAAALGENALVLQRRGPTPEDTLLVIINLRGRLRHNLAEFLTEPPTGYRWTTLLDTEDPRYGGCENTHFGEGAILEMNGPGALLLSVRIDRQPAADDSSEGHSPVPVDGADCKRRRLEQQLTYLREQHDKVIAQIGYTLNDAERLQLQRQAAFLEQEMTNLNQQLSDLPKQNHV